MQIYNEQNSREVIYRIISVYKTLLEEPSFDRYEQHSEALAELFEQLQLLPIDDQEKVLLAEVKHLHDQLVNVIQLEKSHLGHELSNMGKRKLLVGKYDKLSSSYGHDGYFVDYKR